MEEQQEREPSEPTHCSVIQFGSIRQSPGQSQHIIASVLKGGARKDINSIEFGVIHIAIEDVRHVQARHSAIIAKNAKVRIGRYQTGLEHLLAQRVRKGMRHLAIVFHEPGMIGPRLKQNLSAAAACRVQIDQSSARSISYSRYSY